MTKSTQERNGQGVCEQRTRRKSTASTSLTEFARRVAVAVLITLGLAALALMAWRGIHVLLEAFAGVLFGIFLAALAEWVQKHTRLSYGWSLAVVVVTLLVVTVGGFGLLADRIVAQLRGLIGDLPQSVQKMQTYLEQYP
jgi:predicted PurR-regulated permease PerM